MREHFKNYNHILVTSWARQKGIRAGTICFCPDLIVSRYLSVNSIWFVEWLNNIDYCVLLIFLYYYGIQLWSYLALSFLEVCKTQSVSILWVFNVRLQVLSLAILRFQLLSAQLGCSSGNRYNIAHYLLLFKSAQKMWFIPEPTFFPHPQ